MDWVLLQLVHAHSELVAANLPGPWGTQLTQATVNVFMASVNAIDAICADHAERTDKYKLGPGRTVTRGGTAELSPQGFLIFQAIKHRESVPLGELMRPAHDDAIWKERYNQDDRHKNGKIRMAIGRLGGNMSEAGVNISLRVSPPDLIVTYR
jgi:hypothetical protein